MRQVALILWIAVFSLSLTAQEQSEQEQAATESDEPAEAAEDQPEYASDEDFIPTEEIPADKEVTFPADI